MNIFNTLKLLSIAGALTIGFAGCDVDVHEDAEIPHIDAEPDHTVDPSPDGEINVDVPGVNVDVDRE